MKILVISPIPPLPTTGGNRARVLEILSNLVAQKHDVHLLHIEQEIGDSSAMRQIPGVQFHSHPYQVPARSKHRERWQRLMRRLGSNQQYQWGLDSWWPDDADAAIRALQSQHAFEAVLVEYVFFSRALELFDQDVLKVLDTHDVFSDRYQIYLADNQPPQWYSTSRRSEAKGLRRADIAIAIQQHEASFFRSLGCKQVCVVGHSVEVANQPLANGGSQLLYLGANNPINVRSVQWLLDKIWPEVLRLRPDAELAIAGSICQSLPEPAGVRHLGRVDDLSSAYEASSIVVNPMLFGTGLKIKTIEALGRGRPIVTTQIGAAGLEAAVGNGCIVANEANEFANALCDLLAQPERQVELGAAALAFAHGWNADVRKQLGDIWQKRV